MIDTFWLGVLLCFSLIPLPLSMAPWYIARNHLKRSEPGKALKIYRRLYAVYRYLGKDYQACLNYCIGVCLALLGERREAQEHLQLARARWDTSVPRAWRNDANLANAISAYLYALEGDMEAGERLAEIAVSQLSPKSHHAPTVNLYAGAAFLYAERFQEAEAQLNQALEHSKTDKGTKANVYGWLGASAFYQRRFADAFAHTLLAEKCDDASHAILTSILPGRIVAAVELGNLTLAQQAAAKLLPLMHQLEESQRNPSYRALSTLALAQGDLDRALDYAERAYNGHASTREQANSLFLQASVYMQRKNYVRALQMIQEAETYPNFTLYRERLVNLRHVIEAVGTVKVNADLGQTLNQLT